MKGATSTDLGSGLPKCKGHEHKQTCKVFPSNRNSWGGWSKSDILYIYVLIQMNYITEIQFSDIIYKVMVRIQHEPGSRSITGNHFARGVIPFWWSPLGSGGRCYVILRSSHSMSIFYERYLSLHILRTPACFAWSVFSFATNVCYHCTSPCQCWVILKCIFLLCFSQQMRITLTSLLKCRFLGPEILNKYVHGVS